MKMPFLDTKTRAMPEQTMDEVQKEIQQEEELLKPSKEEEVKAKILDKYGLDEEADQDLIEQLVRDRLEDQKRFGEVVKQKRNWREKAQKPPEAPKEPPKEPPKQNTPEWEELLKEHEQKIYGEFRKRDLEALSLPDELKEVVETVAKNTGKTVVEAARDPYVLYQKEQYEAKRKEEEAAISRKNQAAGGKKPEPKDVLDYEGLDMNTPEGRDEYIKRLDEKEKSLGWK